MFENIENLKIISSFHKVSNPYNKIVSRNSNTFIMRAQGSVVYDFYDNVIYTNPGDIIFLPKGVSYESKTVSEEPSVYTSINFYGDFVNAKPVSYSLVDFYEADYIISQFSDLWNLGTPAERHKCMSMFYNLLSYISIIENSSYPEKRKFEIIEPAIIYLKEHIYDCSLNVHILHRLCGISDTYFRQIFVSKFGMTPQKYIISRRLSHARSIIDSGDFHTVGEVAVLVGFNDPLYFSKAFKKMYGVAPSDVGSL